MTLWGKFLFYLILRTELRTEPSELESLVKIGRITPKSMFMKTY